MKWTLLLAGLWLAVSGATAHAVGLNLGWSRAVEGAEEDDCPSSPLATIDRSSACAFNSRSNVLIGSAVVPDGLNDVVAVKVVLDVQTDSPALPDWWRFDAAGCRVGAATLNLMFGLGGSDGICHNGWEYWAATASSYKPDDPAPGHGHFDMYGALPEDLGQPWPFGTEWYVLRLRISNAKTTGTGACAGCTTGALFAFNYCTLINKAGTGVDATLAMADPNGRQCVTWQGGGALACPGIVPAHRTTWGEVKSLYR